MNDKIIGFEAELNPEDGYQVSLKEYLKFSEETLIAYHPYWRFYISVNKDTPKYWQIGQVDVFTNIQPIKTFDNLKDAKKIFELLCK